MIENKEIIDYLENCINVENKVVTYKWLALTKNIAFTQAKKYLKIYKNTHKDVSACYSLVGDQDGKIVLKVVNENEKEQEIKKFSNNVNSFIKQPSAEIYSLHSKPLDDLHMLYRADFSICSTISFQHRGLYPIYNDEVEVIDRHLYRDTAKIIPLGNGSGGDVKNPAVNSVKTENVATSALNHTSFKASISTTSSESNTTSTSCTKTKNTITTSSKPNSSSLAAASVKTNDKKDVKSSKTTKSSNKIETMFSNHKKTEKKETTPIDEKKSKKANAASKKDNKNPAKTGKRKKIIEESSSEDEKSSIFSDEESHSPKRKEFIESDDEPQKSAPKPSSPPATSLKTAKRSPREEGHGVMKKRIMETSSYMDDDGFLITETVAHSVDVGRVDDGCGRKDVESDDDDFKSDKKNSPNKNENKKNDVNKTKSKTNEKRQGEVKEDSGKKRGSKKTKNTSAKQSSMLNFFSKK